MDLEQAEVNAFFCAKVVELGSFKAASELVQILDYCGKWAYRNPINALLPLQNQNKYRIKPETVIHSGGEYPEPISDPSWLIGKAVFEPCLSLVSGSVWVNSFKSERVDSEYNAVAISSSKRHHLTKEAALEHSKVLFGDRS